MVGLAAKKPLYGDSAEPGHGLSGLSGSADATSPIGSEDESGGYLVNEVPLNVRAKTVGETQGAAEPTLGDHELQTGQVSAHDKEDSNKALLFVCLGLVALLVVLYFWG
jgi:hypothetical protein